MFRAVVDIGKRRVVRIIRGAIRGMGFVFSKCHFIFALLDVGSNVMEVI